MFNKNVFKRQQLQFMMLNLVAFTVIFSIFSVIVIGQVQGTLYSKTDEELWSLRDRMLKTNDEGVPGGPADRGGRNGLMGPDMPNPRMIVVHWDAEGRILNEQEIGTTLYENYLADYRLDTSRLDTIAKMEIDDTYHFRYLLFEDLDGPGQTAFTQLLVNTDAEQTIISNFERLIMICAIVFIVLSISASFILSRKMMKPIIHSWNKQSEFVENASHELRTPLTIIQNKLEMLLASPQEKIANKFENIALSLSETRRLSKLTSDLLTLARADSGETQIMKHPIRLDSFIERVCSPYQEIAESQDKQFILDCNSSFSIKADETRLHQLLVILLDNALKYTADGDRIMVRTYPEDQQAIIEVHDTGIGIHEEHLGQIFDRFYREDKARARESGGMGLGLSIAQWIVSVHGGIIQAESKQAEGTVFKIRLPR